MKTNDLVPKNASFLTYRGKKGNAFTNLGYSQLKALLELIRQGGFTPSKPLDPTIKVVISADMYVEDYENFGSNETVRRQQTNSAILSQKGLSQSVMDFEVRMGGEIRVELNINASLVDSNGNIMVDGEIKLYEGTSDSNTDLDGVRQFQIYCPLGASTNYFVRVNNDDEGDDYATVRLSISNTRL